MAKQKQQPADDLIPEEAVTEVAEDAAEVVEKAPKVVLRLCKGAMPMPLVHFIKFTEAKDAVSEVAKKYFTTPGKVSDIQKNAKKYQEKGTKTRVSVFADKNIPYQFIDAVLMGAGYAGITEINFVSLKKEK